MPYEMDLNLEPLLTSRPAQNKYHRLLLMLPLSMLIVVVAGLSYTYSIVNERFYYNGAVSTDNKICSRIGVRILKDGGNAVDAGIAASVCLGTINAFASGIGGGGFALVGGNTVQPIFYNFREQAPQAVTTDMFVKNPIEAQIGAKSIGVPGELMGLYQIHKHHGSMDWSKLFQPSIKLAEQGFYAHALLIKRLQGVESGIMDDPGLSSVYTKSTNNKRVLLETGDLVKRPAYAATLRDIAEHGIDSMYTGDIAKTLVDYLAERGGILTRDDFASYSINHSSPIHLTYRGHDIYTSDLPSGGPVLALMLKIIEHYKLPSHDESADYHRLLEAMKWGYAQRSFFGDPDFVHNATQLVHKMLSEPFYSKIPDHIFDNTTFEPEHYGSNYEDFEDHGTTHLSVVDKTGLSISLTSTVNLNFGSLLMEPSSGIILNDQLDDFSIPGKSNYFGLKSSTANYIAPKKRPQSSTCPALVFKDNKLVLSIGGSGGSRIGTSVFQTILRVLDAQVGVNHAIQMPRIHHQLLPNVAEVETSLSATVMDALRARNHTLMVISKAFSAVQAVHIHNERMYGGADHRKSGHAIGY